jgi:hypothetical protein
VSTIEETAIIWVGKHRQADVRPDNYKGRHRRHRGRGRRNFLTVSLATLLAAAFTTSCAGNPAHEPTPAPGPAVTTGAPSHPRGVEVVLR